MIESGTLPRDFYVGDANYAGRPDFLVHAYNPDFYILRQSACTNFEKPLLYLLFGNERALLLDTGAGKVDVAGTVDDITRERLAGSGRQPIHLIVGHTHDHRDHVAGDTQFTDRPNTTFVGPDLESVRAFFGIEHWPEQIVEYDLGNRVLDVIPIPGHQAAHIAIYDRRTGILVTGDTFYPGRLYVRDGVAFTSSIQRLVDFTSSRTVTHILGTHIENTRTPYVDYPEGTVDQPEEHNLDLTRGQLLELSAVLKSMHGKVTKRVLADFTIWPVQ